MDQYVASSWTTVDSIDNAAVFMGIVTGAEATSEVFARADSK